MEKSRVFMSEIAFKEHMKGAQYIFAYLNRKFPEDIEYLSLEEHHDVISELNKKLELAKEALREFQLICTHDENDPEYRIMGDTYGWCGRCNTKVGYKEDIAKKCLKKLEE